MRTVSKEEQEEYKKGIQLAISVIASIDHDILYEGGETNPVPNCHGVLDQTVSPDTAAEKFIEIAKDILGPQLKAEEIIRGNYENPRYEGIKACVETLNSLKFRVSWGPKATPNFAAKYTKESLIDILSYNLPKETQNEN